MILMQISTLPPELPRLFGYLLGLYESLRGKLSWLFERMKQANKINIYYNS